MVINGMASHRLRTQAQTILVKPTPPRCKFLRRLEACNPSTWQNLTSKENIWDRVCVNAYSASSDPKRMFDEIRRGECYAIFVQQKKV